MVEQRAYSIFLVVSLLRKYSSTHDFFMYPYQSHFHPTTHLLRGEKITLFRQLKCDLATVPHHPKKSSDVVLITQYAKSTKSMLLEGTVTISDG